MEPNSMFKALAISAVVILGLEVPARSQFVQYSAPGSLSKLPDDSSEQAHEEAANAPWKIGPLRFQPHLTLSNLGYYQNAFSAPEGTTQVDDFRATVGAGLAGYVRFGSKSLISAFVAPEYSAWKDTEDLSQLSVNSGMAWFGSFNRLTLLASARSTEREEPLSTELEAPVQISQDAVTFDTTLEITRRLAIFGGASDSAVRHSRDIEQFVPGLDLRDLDRDSSRRVAGLELRGSDLKLGLGYEWTDVGFVASDRRDNTGEGPSFRARYERSRLRAYLTYADLQFDFEDRTLNETSRAIGRVLVDFRFRPNTTASFYASDGLAFATVSSTGVIEAESRGLALRQSLGERLEARFFAEAGQQTFADSQNPGRADDLEAFGFQVRLELSERLTLNGRFVEEKLASTFADLDRSTSSFGFGIELGGDLLPW